MSTFSDSLGFGRRLAALDARLDGRLEAGAADDAARAALKADIIGLFREVEGEIAALTALKEEVKELVGKWKQLPVEDAVVVGTAAVDAPPAAPPVVEPSVEPSVAPAPEPAAEPPVVVETLRVDHLGASTFVAKGWSAISIGDHAAAESALARALELAPDDLEAAALLGWAIMGQERYDDALVVLQGVLSRDPSHALARANVGFVCLQKGIFGEAIEHLVRAARVDADRKAALYATFYLGLVYQRREMFDDACAFFKRALVLGPNLVEARYELGRALWFAGDRAAALEAWRAGASAGKFNAWAKRCGEVCAAVEQGDAPPAIAA